MLHKITIRLKTVTFLALVAVMLTLGFGVDAQTSGFDASGLAGVNIENPTSLQFGPDGRLYVSQQDGRLWAFTVERNGPKDYFVTNTEIIDIIKTQIPNYYDDGDFFSIGNKRQVTGIYVTGTEENPIIYVGSSDYRIGGGVDGGDENLDTNSGVISRLTWNGSTWDHIQLVRGLPRSEENHAINGMLLDESDNTLYVALGGSTNAGAPSNNFAFITEYAYSSTILAVDVDAIDAMPTISYDVQGQPIYYKYNLPTLDDPTRENANGINNPGDSGYTGVDVNDPFGGNDGLNQAKVDPASPVQIYSPGWRNPYDLVITESGRMYSVDNGANFTWGGYPELEGETNCTNQWLAGEPGSDSPGPAPNFETKVNNKDNLHYVTGQGYYAGHPVPVRGNPATAGLYTHSTNGPGTDGVFRTAILPYNDPNYGTQSLPPDWPPYPTASANPVECDYLLSGVDDGALATWEDSTNGITEYTASNLDNAIKGHLLTASFDGTIYRIELNEAGDDATVYTFASGFGATPLDVIAQGDDDIFPGTVWAVTYGAEDITIFEPADYDGGNFFCVGDYDINIDEDEDNYTNADEIDNGTNPCSGAEVPEDFDKTDDGSGFLVSNLNDPDDDNDGLLDSYDPFAIDANNGADLHLPAEFELFNGFPGYGFYGLGFTGLITNGTPASPGTDYLELYENNQIIAGGTAGLLTMLGDDGNTFTNDQLYGFQLGIDSAHIHLPYTVEVILSGPFFSSSSGDPSSKYEGFYIGDGTQDNFVGVVVDANGNVRIIHEEEGALIASSSQTYAEGINLSGASYISLYLTVDPNDETVTPAYSVNGGTLTTIGSEIAVGSSIAEGMNGTFNIDGVPTGMAVGLFSTSGSTEDFLATWDNIKIDYASIDDVGDWALLTTSVGSPDERHESGFIEVGGLMYLVGGRGIKPVNIYDPINDTWTDGASPPVEIHHIQPVEVNGLIYIVAGYSGQCCSSEFGLDHIYIYDPVGDAWHQGAEIPEDRRRGSVGAVVYNDEIYIVGGLEGGHGASATSFDYFDKYNPATNTWTVLQDAPRARDHVNAVLINNKMYLAGGRQTDISGFFNNTLGEVDVYDFNESTWSTLPSGSNIPTERAGAVAEALGADVVVVGGEGYGQAFDTAEALNVNTSLWRTLDPLNVARHSGGMAECNDTLYVAAGSGDQGGSPQLDSVERYSLFGPTLCPANPYTAGTISSDPVSVDFGTVEVGNNNTETITISNSGGTQAILLKNAVLSNTTDFSIDLPYELPVAIDPGETLDIDVTFAPTDADTNNAVLTLNSTTGIPLNVNLFANGSIIFDPVYRVNAGGGAVADTPIQWADQTGFVSGGSDSTAGAVITNTTSAPDPVFDEEHYSNQTWTFDELEPGEYDVNLFFMEGWNGANGEGIREFDVEINGTQVLDNFDIWTEAGGLNIGISRSFVTTVDASGIITVELINQVQNAAIRAIEIVPNELAGGESDLAVKDTIGNDVTTYDFGQSVVGQTTGLVTLNLQNTGSTDPIAVSNIEITGADAANFSLDSSAGTTIAPLSSYSLMLDFTPTDVRTFAATLEITHDGSNGPVTTIGLTGEGVEPVTGTVLYRVNVGGPTLNAADGSMPDWSADTGGTPSIYRTGGGNLYSGTATSAHPGPIVMTHPSLASVPAAPDTLFNTERWDNGGTIDWAFPVATGQPVEVRLYFAELFSGIDQPGQRVLDASVEGIVPSEFDDIDPFDTAGAKGAFVVSYSLVTPDDILNISLSGVIENPALKGVEVVVAGNVPPQVLNPGDQVNFVGDVVDLDILATDEEPFACTAQNLPDGLSISSDCQITGTTTDVCTGLYTSSGSNTLIEEGGLLIADVEFAPTSDFWTQETTIPGAINNSYYEWREGNNDDGFIDPSGALGILEYPIQINTPGIYRFQMRTAGPAQTEHNDVWARFNDADNVFAIKSGFPTTSSSSQTGYYGIGNGWFKVYQNTGSNQWTWTARHKDGDAHNVFVEFVNPGAYVMELSGRSTLFKMDRLVLWQQPVTQPVALNLSAPQSEISGDEECVYDVEVTATNTVSPVLSTTVDFEWTIELSGTNTPPSLSPIADADMASDDELDVFLYSNDLDGDPVTLGAEVRDSLNNLVDPSFYFLNDYGNGDGEITFTPGEGNEGVYTVVISADDSVNPPVTQTFTLTVTEPTVDPVYRVNAGGGSVTDSPIPWEDQAGYVSDGTDSSEGAVTTNTTTAPSGVFDNERYGDQVWTFAALPQGDYTVNLYFMEGWNGADGAGIREFDVEINDVQVLDNFDTWTEAGGMDIGIVRDFNVTVDASGLIVIELINQVQNAAIRAIEIVPVDIVTTPTDLDITAAGGASVSSVNFGQVDVNQPATPILVDLRNLGTDNTITVSDISITGTNAGDFDVAPDTGTTIDPLGNYGLTINFTPSSTGSLSAVLEIIHDGDNGPVTTLDLFGEGVSPSDTVVYRINVGGPTVASADGSTPNWSIDSNANPSPYRTGGGNVYSGNAISAHAGDINMSHPSLLNAPAAPASMFNIERWDNGGTIDWALPVTAGKEYRVRLYFAELYSGIDQPAERVMDAYVEGIVPLTFDNIDPFGEAGAKGALMVSHELVAPDDILNISLAGVIENSSLKGIEVIEIYDPNTPPVIDEIADITINEFEETTVLVNATDAEDAVTLTPVEPLPDFVTWDGVNTFDIEPLIDDAGMYTVTVEASDTQSVVQESFNINVIDRTITITSPVSGASVSNNSVTVMWASSGTSAQDHVHVTLDDEPYVGGQSVNGSYTFTDLTPGQHTITVEMANFAHILYEGVDDVITVNVTNLPPSIAEVPDQTTSEDTEFEIPVVVGDSEDDPLDVSAMITRDSDSAVMDANFYSFELVDTVYILTVTPEIGEAGTYTVQISADDGVNTPPTTETFSLTVTTNQIPEIAQLPDQTNGEGDILGNTVPSVQISATDAENDPLVYSMSGQPTGLDIDPNTGVITGTVADGASASSPYTVIVSVVDGVNPQPAEMTFQWTIEAGNAAPIVSAGDDATITLPTNTYALQGSVSDPTPTGTLTTLWTATGPATVVFTDDTNPTTTATFSVAGTYTLTLTANDGEFIFSDDVIITVSESAVVKLELWNSSTDTYIRDLQETDTINLIDTPNITVIAVTEPATVGSVQFTLDDVPERTENAAPYTVGADNGAGNLDKWDIGIGDYVLKATPYSAQNAAGDAGVAKSINLTVTGNYLPEVVQLADQLHVENDVIGGSGLPAIQVVATDADEDSLFYNMSGQPAGINIDLSTGLITGTIASDAADFSPYTVTVSVFDGVNPQPGEMTFQWTVEEFSTENTPPTVNAGNDASITLPTNTYTLQGSVMDVTFSGTLTAQWSSPDGVSFADATATDTVATFPSAGTYTLTLTGNDGELTSTDEVVITVLPEVTGPQVVKLELWDSSTDTFIRNLLTTDTINLQQTPNFNVVAVTNPATVGSVRFFLDGTMERNENAAPYAVGGDNNGDFNKWTIGVGEYELKATPYEGANGGGLEGASLTVNLTIIDDSTTNSPPIVPEQAFSVESGEFIEFNLEAGIFDSDGHDIVLVEIVDGPDNGTITGTAPNLTYTPNPSFIGDDMMTVAAQDELGAVTESQYTMIVRSTAANAAPVADAGTDATISLPTNTYALQGGVSDPTATGTLTSLWTGPAGVTFADDTSPTTTVTLPATEGTYTLTLTANDGEFTDTDNIVITVGPANAAPVANAGTDATITLPNNTYTLQGSVSDPTSTGILSASWTGPAGVTFADSSNPLTSVTFPSEGTYTLTLTANDGEFTNSDEMVVTVEPAPAGQNVVALQLWNADTDTYIRNLNATDTIDLQETPNVNVVAITNPATVGSVQFYLNGEFERNENVAPYTVGGDTSGDYKVWNITAGEYTFTVTPFSESSGGGTVGGSMVVELTVTD